MLSICLLNLVLVCYMRALHFFFSYFDFPRSPDCEMLDRLLVMVNKQRNTGFVFIFKRKNIYLTQNMRDVETQEHINLLIQFRISLTSRFTWFH